MSDERAVVPAAPAGLSFGQTNLRGDQIVPPRVKVIQSMSQERVDGKGKEGEFFNVLFGENYGTEITFAPIQAFMTRLFLSRPERRDAIDNALASAGLPVLTEGDGLKCRSIDMHVGNGDPGIECEKCPLSKWGPGNTAPLCSEVYNVAAVNELGQLIILSFQKSAAKTGRRFFSMLRFGGESVPWATLYKASTHTENLKGKGTFAVPDITRLPDKPAPELQAAALRWATQLGATDTWKDVTPEDDEDIAPDPVAVASEPVDEDAPF